MDLCKVVSLPLAQHTSPGLGAQREIQNMGNENHVLAVSHTGGILV